MTFNQSQRLSSIVEVFRTDPEHVGKKCVIISKSEQDEDTRRILRKNA